MMRAMMDDESAGETTHVVPPNEITGDDYDTPTMRASINQMSVDDLDAMLEVIRSRRLERVKKLEAVAKLKADDVRLATWLKFQRAYMVAKRAVARLEEQDAKTEKLVHKCRLLALAAQLEVGEADDESADQTADIEGA